MAMRDPGAGNGGSNRLILITGGAGFLGSHLADDLLALGYRVRALDNLSEQVHGDSASRPGYLHEDVELVRGDVRDPSAVRRALQGVDAVFHFAAAVGVGQSMYEIERYTDVNNRGTAVLLEALMAAPVSRLVVASSMGVYGEGMYVDAAGRAVTPAAREPDHLLRGDWELHGDDGQVLSPLPTPESMPASPLSIYALSKLDQERMCLLIGQAYAIPTVALRFFNVYGPRQALSNPYTGVLAIFAGRYRNRRAPLVFEDGGQRRDFVNVRDAANACVLALQTPAAAGMALNIGSGRPVSILEVAEQMAHAFGVDDLPPEITGKYRAGDTRHCFADIGLAREVLDYRPHISLADGLEALVDWALGQRALDRVDAARAELELRGLQR